MGHVGPHGGHGRILGGQGGAFPIPWTPRHTAKLPRSAHPAEVGNSSGSQTRFLQQIQGGQQMELVENDQLWQFPLGSKIKHLITIVSPRTFQRWVQASETEKKAACRGNRAAGRRRGALR